MVMFDTSILIDSLKGVKKAIDTIESYKGEEEATIAIVTKYELLRSRKGLKLEVARMFVDTMNICYFGEKEMEKTIGIYEALKGKGKLINELDMMIAGTAEANGQVLVASDEDFNEIGSDKIKVMKK